jgi:hypothetical protein
MRLVMRGNEEDDVEVKRTVKMSKVVIGRRTLSSLADT